MQGPGWTRVHSSTSTLGVASVTRAIYEVREPTIRDTPATRSSGNPVQKGRVQGPKDQWKGSPPVRSARLVFGVYQPDKANAILLISPPSGPRRDPEPAHRLQQDSKKREASTVATYTFFLAPFLPPFVRRLFLPTAMVLLREPKGRKCYSRENLGLRGGEAPST